MKTIPVGFVLVILCKFNSHFLFLLLFEFLNTTTEVTIISFTFYTTSFPSISLLPFQPARHVTRPIQGLSLLLQGTMRKQTLEMRLVLMLKLF